MTEIHEGLVPFDTKFCDLKTKVLFEDWSTVAAVRIMCFVQTRNGSAIFSQRGIGIVCNLPKTTVKRTLDLLVEKKYLIRKDDSYYPNTKMVVHERTSGGPSTGQSGPNIKKSGPSVDPNNQYNNQKNINKTSSGFRNDTVAARANLIGDNLSPWERKDFKPENLTKEQRQKILEQAGFKS